MISTRLHVNPPYLLCLQHIVVHIMLHPVLGEKLLFSLLRFLFIVFVDVSVGATLHINSNLTLNKYLVQYCKIQWRTGVIFV